jgi:alpha-glucosidase
MTVIAESPVALLSNPAYAPALPFIKEMPTCWDETRVLPGSDISKRALLARRKGDTWYVVALNGEEPAVLDVRLDFLSEGRWHGNGLLDSPDRTFVSREDAFLSGGILTVELSAGGGALWRLDREAR